ncbi:MAG: hypothetical protein WC752_00805 [Patescibacteria group bacterium]|jgi:hypothetical protein
MPKTIIIDFDHTLFNAQLFKKAIAKALGMSLADWEKDYQKNKKKFTHYNYKQQIKNLPLANQKKFLNILKNSNKYLYKDAIIFLRSIKNNKIILLSKGEPSLQEQKIINSGVKKYLQIKTTDRPKVEFIKKIKNKENIIFINDRGKEIDEIKKVYPNVYVIWVRRTNGQYKNEPCKKYDKKVNNLKIKL